MTTTRRLIVDPPAAAPDPPSREELLWRDPPAPSSFRTSVGSGLAELGEVPPPSRDAVWLTTTVFVADRTVSRPKSKTRDMAVDVPVSEVAAWTDQAAELEDILASFTSDNWTVRFRDSGPVAVSPAQPALEPPVREPDLVCLLSGGADSLCGAVKALDEGRQPLLLSHWDTNAHKPIQRALVDRLQDLFGPVEHRQIRIARAAEQIGGPTFPNETTKRSRSLLFLSLGLAQAAACDVDELWIPENGWASLNPPLAPERLGAMSTRTTDPVLLGRFDRVLAAVGAHHGITNPFELRTKGEMFADVARILGQRTASELLSATHSCSHSRLAGEYGQAFTTQCGLCFGCTLRRAAFAAASIDDRTPYLDTILTGADLADFAGKWSDDVRAMAYATRRGVQPHQLLALRLPDRFSLDDAHNLLVRGFDELAQVTP